MLTESELPECNWSVIVHADTKVVEWKPKAGQPGDPGTMYVGDIVRVRAKWKTAGGNVKYSNLHVAAVGQGTPNPWTKITGKYLINITKGKTAKAKDYFTDAQPAQEPGDSTKIGIWQFTYNPGKKAEGTPWLWCEFGDPKMKQVECKTVSAGKRTP